MKIEIEVSELCEATRSPWWMIIVPKQNMSTDKNSSHNIAGMITGPFFSLKEAVTVLERERYNFGRNAVVYCASGAHSGQYAEGITEKEGEK